MISIMIKSAMVLAVAGCIASALRRQSAALRHAIWTAGLIASSGCTSVQYHTPGVAKPIRRLG